MTLLVILLVIAVIGTAIIGPTARKRSLINAEGRALEQMARNAVSGRGATGLAWEAATVDKTEHTYCALQLATKVAPMTVCPPAEWAARGFKPKTLAHSWSSGDPQFDQLFTLVSTYPQGAVPLLTPALKHYVANTGMPFTVDDSGYLLTWRPGRITDGAQLWAQGQALAHFAQLLHR